MTITQSTLYWITRCDELHAAGIVFSMVFMFGTLFSALHLIIDKPDRLFDKFVCLICAICFPIFTAVAVLVPTTKEMAAIIVIPELANSKTVKELGDGVVTLAMEWLEELRPNKKGETR